MSRPKDASKNSKNTNQNEQPLANNDEILHKLSKIPVPGSGKSIIEEGILREATASGEALFIKLNFDEENKRFSKMIEAQVRNGMRTLGFEKTNIVSEGTDHEDPAAAAAAPPPPQQPQHQHPPAQPQQQAAQLLESVKNVIAVSSGKGGVGKSSVSVNIACALAKLGQKVGILDADVYGPNVPMMFGLEGKRPEVSNNQVLPLEKFEVRIMSLGFLAPQDEAIIWRGPLVGRAIEQMLRDVAWGELDFLILDMPPGTGDAQLTISQRLELSGAILVSTPQPVALADGIKGLKMFQKVNVPILGLIENMSSFICEHGTEYDIFGKGGVKKAATYEKVPFLGEIPITIALREGGDVGKPIVLEHPDSAAAQAFLKIGEQLISQLEGAEHAAPKHFKL